MKYKLYIKAFVYANILAAYACFTHAMLSAYFKSCKCVTIMINNYNEANIEIVILILGIIGGIYLLIDYFIERRKKRVTISD